jgi:hypothetical protein
VSGAALSAITFSAVRHRFRFAWPVLRSLRPQVVMVRISRRLLKAQGRRQCAQTRHACARERLSADVSQQRRRILTEQFDSLRLLDAFAGHPVEILTDEAPVFGFDLRK